jgi:hypothetical protein
MADSVDLRAFQRGGSANDQFRYLRSDSEGGLQVSYSLPPYAELSRRGLGWQVMDTSATAALVVRPSTVAGLTLYNGETGATAKSYVIDRCFAFNLVSTDAIADWSLWATVHPTMTAPTADITAIKSMSGLTAYTGAAIVDTGASVLDSGWFPIGSGHVGNPGGVTPGTAIVAEVAGRLIVPPGGGISINVVASLVGWTFTHGFSWYEIELDV